MEGVGCIIALNDFTKKNGATTILPKSHLMDTIPDESEYNTKCISLECAEGSVIVFDGRLIHRGETNMSDQYRHALALGFYKPYIKQRINIPVVIDSKYNTVEWDKYLKTKLGYYGQSPSSLEEFVARRNKNY
jgi:ectoine hydroxylase-related dioxygenase (phytanoyl-CoA dioxygenase family)